jgi:hypothetical protein
MQLDDTTTGWRCKPMTEQLDGTATRRQRDKTALKLDGSADEMTARRDDSATRWQCDEMAVHQRRAIQ